MKDKASISELSSETETETILLLLLLLLLLFLERRWRKLGVDKTFAGKVVLVVVMAFVVVVVVVEKKLVEVERRIGSRQVESSGRSGSLGSFL